MIILAVIDYELTLIAPDSDFLRNDHIRPTTDIRTRYLESRMQYLVLIPVRPTTQRTHVAAIAMDVDE